MNCGQVTLKLAALLLSYPAQGRRTLWREAPALLPDLCPLAVRDELAAFLAAQSEMGQEELEQHYVEAFDFRQEGALHLTYHEHGDLPARGPALLALQDRLREDGVEPADGELADYLPLLLEWQAGREGLQEDVAARMATAFRRVLGGLEGIASPYAHVVRAVLGALPEAAEEGGTPPEAPDPADVPYPLHPGR